MLTHMKTIRKIALGACAALLFAACSEDNKAKDDSTSVTPIPQWSSPTGILGNFIQDQLNDRTQNFTLSGGSGIIIGQSGTYIQFNNAFVMPNGGQVTGDVELEMIEIFDKGSMILTQKTTIADLGGVFAPLESGGELYLAATQNGTDLKKNPNGTILVKMPVLNTALSPQPGMALYYGNTGSESDAFTWTEADSATVTPCRDSSSFSTENYCFYTDSLQWINVDKLANNPAPTTPLQLTLPPGYTTTNTIAAISFDGVNMAAAMDQNFASPFDISIGMPIHIVVIAENAGALEFAIIPITVAANLSIPVQFTPGTPAQLQTLLLNLP